MWLNFLLQESDRTQQGLQPARDGAVSGEHQELSDNGIVMTVFDRTEAFRGDSNVATALHLPSEEATRGADRERESQRDMERQRQSLLDDSVFEEEIADGTRSVIVMSASDCIRNGRGDEDIV